MLCNPFPETKSDFRSLFFSQSEDVLKTDDLPTEKEDQAGNRVIAPLGDKESDVAGEAVSEKPDFGCGVDGLRTMPPVEEKAESIPEPLHVLRLFHTERADLFSASEPSTELGRSFHFPGVDKKG